MENDAKPGILFGAIATLGLVAALAMIAHKKYGCSKCMPGGKSDLAFLFKQLKWKLKIFGVNNKEKYDEIVHSLVHEYANQKNLAVERREELLHFLKGQWEMFQTKYQAAGHDGIAAMAAAGGNEAHSTHHCKNCNHQTYE